MKAVLLLKDQTIFYGRGFGARASRLGELIFNTSMTGYQEALTDPSYAGQILLMTYPLIGNYGINELESESDKIHLAGFGVKEACTHPDHRDNTSAVHNFLAQQGVPGMEGFDIRYLVRKIRYEGVMPAMLLTYDDSVDLKAAFSELASFDYGQVDFVRQVTRKQAEIFGGDGKGGSSGKVKTVVLVDYGAKMGIVRDLVARGLRVVVVPSFATFDDIAEHEPSGIVLSNGPGDPAVLTDAHKTIRALLKHNYPLFGICLGHQLLAHAAGGNTFKLKFGHHGSNHPVLDKVRDRITITTQNHGYAVAPDSVPKDFEVTHVNVNDSTIEGMRHKDKPVFSVQFHPESSPGPHDSKYLFDAFINTLR